MILSNYISSSINNFKRIIKIFCFGELDVRTGTQYLASGIDSSPITGMKTLYAKTSNSSEPVVIGYINEAIVEDGEIRIFSHDSNGTLSYVKCNNNSQVELNGNADNAIKYVPLSESMSLLADNINIELGKIAEGIIAAGGTYTPTNINIDISSSKVESVRLP